jgi:hypothetical protein
MDQFETNLRDALRESGNRSSVASHVMARLASRRTSQARRRNLVLMAVAALSVLAALYLAVFRPLIIAPVAFVHSADGALHQGADVIAVGGRVQVGSMLHSEGGAVLTLADGSEVEMQAKSELSLQHADDGIRVDLGQGAVIVKAANQVENRRLYVTTKDITVSVVGTVFLVNAEPAGSRVAVLEGEVRVQRGTSERKLQPGEQVSTNPRMQFLSLSEEISWSEDAEAHLTLLLRSAPGRALIDAAARGRLETVQRLLGRGVDPNVSVPGDGSPLIVAARRGRMEVVRLLLESGADSNMPVPGDGNPLIAAAVQGHADVAALLLDRGARIDEAAPGDENALISASGEGRLNVVQLLVGRGANVNARVWSGPTLVRNGPTIGQSPGEWRSPLSMARSAGRRDVVQFLLSVGAKE